MMTSTKVYSYSPEPRKLCGMRIAINYTPLSMAYDSTANFLSLGPTVFICTCISKEQRCKEELCGVRNFEFEPVIRRLWQRVN